MVYFQFTSVIKISLNFYLIFVPPSSYDLQKELSLEIGVHVSNEHPWKTVKKELLEDYLTDSTVETENLRAKLSLIDDNDCSLLVGYHCPAEDNVEDGVFIVYDEIESILIATELIRKLEIWKRFKVKRALQKKPTRRVLTASRGKPKDLQNPRPKITVQIQTKATSQRTTKSFSFRTSADCRDGFLELRPQRNEVFKNVHRRRVAQAIQSAAQRVDREQQTDPTFPTNAHTQYFYEIKNEEKVQEKVDVVETSPGDAKENNVEAEEDGEGETLLSVDGQQKPILVSKQVKELIRTLEYNQIDLYRIEYESLGQREIPRFRIPFLEEVFSFADIGRTANRHVAQIEWHPKYSGLFVATYTWHTLSTFSSSAEKEEKEDEINRIILQPNFIFMWSFEDTLTPLLSFESPREVCTVSFHPLDPNCLIGGLVNGQVIIWDLEGVVESVSDEIAEDDLKYVDGTREDMRKFLNWTKHSFNKDVVKRSAISSLEYSQRGRVTCIQWLNSSVQLSSAGDLKEREKNDREGKVYRYFVTASLDCTIAFYNLDDGSIPEDKEPQPPTNDDKKQQQKMKKKKSKSATPVPEIKTPKTKFAHFDRKFRPQFVIVLQEPISAFVMNAARFAYHPVASMMMSADLSTRMTFKAEELPFALEREFTVEDEEEGVFHNNLIVSTLTGDVTVVKWKSSETDPAGGSNRQEKPMLRSYPALHDGPVVALDKNPEWPLLILSIGCNTVAVWRTDFIHGAIYSQRRNVELSDCKWSLFRPSVFFLSRTDGNIEIWDLLCSTQAPLLVETISGGCLTVVSQHRLPIGFADVLAIGDFNSNVRIFKLPKSFSEFGQGDREKFSDQIAKEVARKIKLRDWQRKWEEEENYRLKEKMKSFEGGDEERAGTGNQLIQRVGVEMHRKKGRGREEEKKKKKTKSLVEIGELKWEEKNYRRLMRTMMVNKDIDPEEVS